MRATITNALLELCGTYIKTAPKSADLIHVRSATRVGFLYQFVWLLHMLCDAFQLLTSSTDKDAPNSFHLYTWQVAR